MPQKRVTIQDEDGANTGKWFDPETGRKWEEATWFDGSNRISRATGTQWEHEVLFRTASGAWILHHWSQWQGSRETYTQITAKAAAGWLVRNEHEPPEEFQVYVTEAEV